LRPVLLELSDVPNFNDLTRLNGLKSREGIGDEWGDITYFVAVGAQYQD
jgi:hypothetical protein